MQDHKTKYKMQMTNYQIQIDNTTTISNGDLQKEYCTIFQCPDGCNADQGSLILATSHTHKQKMGCEHDLSQPITHTRP